MSDIVAKKKLRDRLQLGIYKIINPFVRFLIKIGFTPNKVTLTGLVLNIGVAVIFILGAEKGNRGDFQYVGWAGALILFAGLFDMLDGQVARLGNMSSTFGAMFDSVLDRYSEMVMFLGICYYLIAHHYFLSSLFAFIALIGSMMVSYTRARAEGLGIECKGGFMQRPERVVLIGVSALLCGIISGIIGDDYKKTIPGIDFPIFETITIFTFPIFVMAIMTNITAYGRLMDSKKALDLKDAMKNKTAILVLAGLLSFSLLQVNELKANPVLIENMLLEDGAAEKDPPLNLPVPNEPNQLFYLQRDPNTNTIVYSLNIEDGQLNESNPIKCSWILYPEGGKRKELNYIQRTFAYGLKASKLKDGNYKLSFVAYKKRDLFLIKDKATNQFKVYLYLNGRLSVLNRAFIKIEPGGSFWSPDVRYIQMYGTDSTTGEAIVERIQIATK
ncbi:DUF4833 domain-containing protein [Polluticaenibacter yanchengensis]|uniref:DUF4833 domain-containing protein n=1 Tax=Polluticaenibacter yanchengensis TaxID=3014562 RepID=A0ABT4UGA3_9BACT|nr:DUF4833 domain-containing protein [Chitinophagaceae bacterium LY-5]